LDLPEESFTREIDPPSDILFANLRSYFNDQTAGGSNHLAPPTEAVEIEDEAQKTLGARRNDADESINWLQR
jgi:hypothetical protein